MGAYFSPGECVRVRCRYRHFRFSIELRQRTACVKRFGSIQPVATWRGQTMRPQYVRMQRDNSTAGRPTVLASGTARHVPAIVFDNLLSLAVADDAGMHECVGSAFLGMPKLFGYPPLRLAWVEFNCCIFRWIRGEALVGWREEQCKSYRDEFA